MNNQKKILLAQFWEDFWSEADNPFFTFLLRAGLFYWIVVVFISVKDGFSVDTIFWISPFADPIIGEFGVLYFIPA